MTQNEKLLNHYSHPTSSLFWAHGAGFYGKKPYKSLSHIVKDNTMVTLSVFKRLFFSSKYILCIIMARIHFHLQQPKIVTEKLIGL